MLAFGGIGTLFGPIVGAFTFTVVDEVLIEFGQLRHVAYGALIIALFVWMPRGLILTLTSLGNRFRWLAAGWERMKRFFVRTKEAG